MYNLLSLFLGCISLIAAFCIPGGRNRLLLCMLSAGCCGLSLLCQLLDLGRLARIEDAAALLDTAPARALAGIVLVGGLLVLYARALICRKS